MEAQAAQALFSMEEYSELKTCDHYLSWGWIDEHYNVIPVGALKEVVKKSKNNRETSILLLISSILEI